jgi:3-deoxy-D-manno-octulosonate 8-phosphate phosphatase (KDO 8-P phosphatase)
MPQLNSEEFARRAAEIEWVLCDVDGVLTDGGLYYDRRGNTILRFDVRDGLALKLAQRAGLKVGALSGRRSRALTRRAGELGFDELISGSIDKGKDFEKFVERQGTTPRRVAFVGDDLPDLVILGRTGMAFAPADAVPEVRAVVHTVLDSRGGEGAVREMIERLLKARGDWDRLLSVFSFEG